MPQRIVRVHPGSLAARSGIREGETLVSINRTPVLDLVDYQYLTARPSLEMLLEDDNGHSRTVHIHKLIEEPLGLTLESSLMSCPKTCRVKGCPARKEAVMRAYLRKDAKLSRVSVTDYPARGALEIVTGYRVMEPGECARLEVELMTGRTHQIRAHLAHIGHPILGDDKYGDRALNRQLGLRRQQLWATRLVFHADGVLAELDGQTFTVKCPF